VKRKLVIHDKKYNYLWGKNVDYAIKDEDDNWWIAKGADENYVCQDPDLKKRKKQTNIKKYSRDHLLLAILVSVLAVSLAYNLFHIML
jgi:hypothetical protein